MQKIKLKTSVDGTIDLTIDGLKIENVITAYCDGDKGIITIRIAGGFTTEEEVKNVNIAESAAETETSGKRTKKA